MSGSDWRELHEKATVVDWHSHPALKMSLFHRDMGSTHRKPLARLFSKSFWPLSVRTGFDQVDKGGLDVQLSTIYVPEEQWFQDLPLLKVLRWLTPSVKKFLRPSYFDTTIASLDLLEDQVKTQTHPRRFSVVKNASQMDKALDRGDVVVIHSVEGAHSLQGDSWGKIVDPDERPSTVLQGEACGNLERLHERGVAYLTVGHFYPNCCVESPCFPYPEYGFSFLKKEGLFDKWDHTRGLTELGEVIVEKMLELGMLIDITHLTPVARSRVYDIVDHHGKDSCLIASHIGAYSLNADPYCLRDWEIKWLADHGCAIGVIFMNYWLAPTDTNLGIKYLVGTIEHMADVGGVDVVSLGTDFDGFTDPPDEIKDMSELPRLTRELVSLRAVNNTRRFSDDDVEKILGLNSLGVLRRGWKGPSPSRIVFPSS